MVHKQSTPGAASDSTKEKKNPVKTEHLSFNLHGELSTETPIPPTATRAGLRAARAAEALTFIERFGVGRGLVGSGRGGGRGRRGCGGGGYGHRRGSGWWCPSGVVHRRSAAACASITRSRRREELLLPPPSGPGLRRERGAASDRCGGMQRREEEGPAPRIFISLSSFQTTRFAMLRALARRCACGATPTRAASSSSPLGVSWGCCTDNH